MHMTIVRMRLITQPQATEYETKSTHVRNCASWSSQAGMSHTAMLCRMCRLAVWDRSLINLFVNLISSDLSYKVQQVIETIHDVVISEQQKVGKQGGMLA